jgi:hypothetical protein
VLHDNDNWKIIYKSWLKRKVRPIMRPPLPLSENTEWRREAFSFSFCHFNLHELTPSKEGQVWETWGVKRTSTVKIYPDVQMKRIFYMLTGLVPFAPHKTIVLLIDADSGNKILLDSKKITGTWKDADFLPRKTYNFHVFCYKLEIPNDRRIPLHAINSHKRLNDFVHKAENKRIKR